MKIIIVGCGKVGAALAQELVLENHDISIIDMDSALLDDITNTIDVIGVVGNGASYSIQKEAGIETADLMIAVTNSDELNLLCCVIAKKAANCHTIARVRSPIYNQEIGFIKKELGISMVINPELAAATEIARLLRFPSAIKIDTFAKGKVDLLKFHVEPNSKLDGLKVYEISTNLHCDVLVCVIERGDEIIIPNGNIVLKGDDKISIIATPKKAADFFKKVGIVTNQVKNAMIVGASTIAYYLSQHLLSMGIKVKIIEKDKGKCEYMSEALQEATIINGDATDHHLLLEESIENTESFVALTNLDEENIMLSLYVGSKTHAKLITKITRLTYGDVIDTLKIGSIINPKLITADQILQYVRAMGNASGSNVETLYKLVNNRVEALEFVVRNNSEAVDVTLQLLNTKDNLLICCINRNGKIIIPRGQDKIQVGDTVIVATTHQGLNDINDILGH